MKHEITTYHTKKLMADTLKGLMHTKPFSKITVSEVVKTCGINRKTFYYHFDDIYALLKWMLDEEVVDVVKHFDLLSHYEKAIRFTMKYVDENKYIINCVCDSIGREEMKRFFYADFVGIVTAVIDEARNKRNSKTDPALAAYAAKFYTEAIAGMLLDWVKEKDKSDREQVVHYMTAIIESALRSMD